MSETIKLLAIRGIQGGHATYTVQIPLCKVEQLFYISPCTDAKKSYQRAPSPTRKLKIADYLLNNPTSYVLPTVTAFPTQNDLIFSQIGDDFHLGYLEFSSKTKLALFDGQNRISGILEALTRLDKDKTGLGTIITDHISVLILEKRSLDVSRQIFADINMNAVKPSQSIKLLFNNRDISNKVTRQIIDSNTLFENFVDYSSSNLGNDSPYLYTFSAIHGAVEEMVKGLNGDLMTKISLIEEFFSLFTSYQHDLELLVQNLQTPQQIRENSIIGFSVTLQAIANFGVNIIQQHPEHWQGYIQQINSLNFGKGNPDWKHRVIIDGRIKKSRSNSILIANMLLKTLGVQLSSENAKVEKKFQERIEELKGDIT